MAKGIFTNEDDKILNTLSLEQIDLLNDAKILGVIETRRQAQFWLLAIQDPEKMEDLKGLVKIQRERVYHVDRMVRETPHIIRVKGKKISYR